MEGGPEGQPRREDGEAAGAVPGEAPGETPTERITPLGAPTDLLRPAGRLSPVRDPPPAPSLKDGPAGIGVVVGLLTLFLAFAGFWFVDLLTFGRLSGPRVGTWYLVYWAIVLGPAAALHAYALGQKRRRILPAFWTTVVIGLMVFVVTCFAVVWVAFN